ncbi:MAG: hypothetical protein HY820_24520 [Acidobacteria bacterium]|nr:hypothetical protein [Acidobacteriota bacterium]
MKRTWMTMVFAAAAISATASAQELNANIPFDFAVGGKQLAAGSYSISTLRGTGPSGIIVQNRDTKQAAILIALTTTTTQSYGQATLVFRCQPGSCTIAEVHTPNGTARSFLTPALRSAEKERTMAIRLSSGNTGNGF